MDINDPVAPCGAAFLDGLTNAICEARAEYTKEYQDAWLAGTLSVGPDEFLALVAADYTRKNGNLVPDTSGNVRIPNPNMVSSRVVEEEMRLFWQEVRNNLAREGIAMKSAGQLYDMNRITTFNFIGALRKRTTKK